MSIGPQDGVVQFIQPTDPAQTQLHVMPAVFPSSIAPSRTVHPGMWWLDTSISPFRLRRRNEANTAWDPIGAPVMARYVTQTPHAELPNEQALSLLPTGVLKSTTSTGVLSIAAGSDLPAHQHAHVHNLDALSDVTVNAPTAPQGVFYSGTEWVNRFPPLSFTLGPFHWYSLPRDGTADLGISYFTNNASTVLGSTGSVASGENQWRMPTAGRIVAGFLMAHPALSVGTITLQVRLNAQATIFLANTVALDTTNKVRASAAGPAGVLFSSGDTIGASVVTAGLPSQTPVVTAFLVAQLDLA
jgi:hypothetical protein